jgi:sugar transferase EpsL
VKRVFDIVITLVTAPAILPLIFLVGIFVFIFVGRPIFFLQSRAGLNGQAFTLIKFRSMTNAGLNDGRVGPDAGRITTFGKVIRSTSLDELPEFWNVLRGDMSLVGPRPLLMQYLDRYDDRQRKRHDVRPGLTGWAQVNGRNALSWEEKFELDVWYVENRNMMLDCKIIGLTVLQILGRKGISATGEATMPEFMGSKKV